VKYMYKSSGRIFEFIVLYGRLGLTGKNLGIKSEGN